MSSDPLRLRDDVGIYRWIDLFQLVAEDETGAILADYALDEPSRVAALARAAVAELKAVEDEDHGDPRSSESGERQAARAEPVIRRTLDEAFRISPRTARVLEALGVLSHEAVVQPFIFATSILMVARGVDEDDDYLPALDGEDRSTFVEVVGDFMPLTIDDSPGTEEPAPTDERLVGLAADLRRLVMVAELHRRLVGELSEASWAVVVGAVDSVARERGMELHIEAIGFDPRLEA